MKSKLLLYPCAVSSKDRLDLTRDLKAASCSAVGSRLVGGRCPLPNSVSYLTNLTRSSDWINLRLVYLRYNLIHLNLLGSGSSYRSVEHGVDRYVQSFFPCRPQLWLDFDDW